MKRLLFVCVFLAAPLAAAAAVQDSWARDAGDRLYMVLSRDGREGARLLGSPATGVLYAEGIAERTVRLQPGEHVIVATCETACDLDVRAFDADGRPAAADTDDRPHALADVEVRRPATLRVRVEMAACAAEPCRYAVGTFRVEP